MKFLLKSIILFGLLHSAQVVAQGFLKAEGKEIVNENGEPVLLRGMGLGGWMLQEGYMMQTSGFAGSQWRMKEFFTDLMGEENTQEFYDLWLQNYMQEADIIALKNWGFNSIRLPLHYNLFTLPIEDEPIAGQHTWLEKGFTLTDSLIHWCKAHEMYIILDLHAAPGGQGYSEEISDYNPNKPSLWQSELNREKTVALWRRIAERYKDEEWIGAYDLLNEPNWDIPNGTALWTLYQDITQAIREVDINHLIIIEGNWFANDFTGLPALWDNNIALGPHKYWSFNNPSDNNWLINLRDNNNAPIYLGESGENSNVWFTDAIGLLESEGFGWAWWPHKKVESISTPLSIQRPSGYQAILNYGNGSGSKPSAENAAQTMFALAENVKFQNCRKQFDVIDAMFRQVQTDETIPYSQQNIPGVIYMSDFDLGRNGFAYNDPQTATYHVTTGNFTAWNNGWVYRNDGIDIEHCSDNINTNGYNVGWLDEGEWMKYSVDVLEEGLYDVHIRASASGFDGSFALDANHARLSHPVYVPNTNGYQNWTSVNLDSVVITSDVESIRFVNQGSEYNISSLEFVKIGETTDIDARFEYGKTRSKTSISIDISKPIEEIDLSAANDFTLNINGSPFSIVDIELDPTNNRKILLYPEIELHHSFGIWASYTGNTILAEDGTSLLAFTNRPIDNQLEFEHRIPGKIEAEDFRFQSGIELEDCQDIGGGLNIGYLDNGDFAEYLVDVEASAIYNLTVRAASDISGGTLAFELENSDGVLIPIGSINTTNTGGWQNWEDFSTNFQVPEGSYILRMKIVGNQFNVNWFEFKNLSSTESVDNNRRFLLFPNPTKNELFVKFNQMDDLEKIEVIDIFGRSIKVIKGIHIRNTQGPLHFETTDLMEGIYYVRAYWKNHIPTIKSFVKN